MLILFVLLIAACGDDSSNGASTTSGVTTGATTAGTTTAGATTAGTNGATTAGTAGTTTAGTAGTTTAGTTTAGTTAGNPDMAMPMCVSCPTGYSCNGGVCTAANPTPVQVDVELVAVTGTLTLNGSAATNVNCTAGQRYAMVAFLRQGGGDQFTANVTFPGNGFSAKLPPGTYNIDVETANPYAACDGGFAYQEFYTVQSGVVVAAGANVAVDVKLVNVTGTLTLNGAAATNVNCTAGQHYADVLLRNRTSGESFDAYVSSPGNSFSARVTPGTYSIDVQAQNPYAACDGGFAYQQYSTVKSGVAVAAGTNLPVDVKLVNITGTLTLNGSPATNVNCTAGQHYAEIVLSNQTTGDYFSAYLSSPGNGFSAKVTPGTYSITVQAQNPYAACDGGFAYQEFSNVASGVAVASGSTVPVDVKLANVSGTLTLNGAAPVNVNCAGSAHYASVLFHNLTTHDTYQASLSVPGNSFSTKVAPGMYDLEVQAQVPYVACDGGFAYQDYNKVVAGLSVSASGATVPVDVKLLAVTGTLTLNGAHATNVDCMSGQTYADVVFRNQTSGDSYADFVASPGNSYSAKIPPGTYDVDVQAQNPYATCNGGFGYQHYSRAATGVSIASATTVPVDVKLISVSGTLTLNHAPATNVSCTSGQHYADVLFRNLTTYDSFDAYVSTPGNSFSVQLEPGNYAVEVQAQNPWAACDGGFAYQEFSSVIAGIRLP